MFRSLVLALPLALLTLAGGGGDADIRIKYLVEFDGLRGNDLVNYGLVVDLPGTGDGLCNALFTEEALQNLLERLGVNVMGEQLRPKNVAVVLVTAELPAFARAGRRIDVSVAAIGRRRAVATLRGRRAAEAARAEARRAERAGPAPAK